jgi:hypothetical protein
MDMDMCMTAIPHSTPCLQSPRRRTTLFLVFCDNAPTVGDDSGEERKGMAAQLVGQASRVRLIWER